MDLILCPIAVDFDTLGAAVGLACLSPGSRIVLPGEVNPDVNAFLAVHRDEYPLIEQQAITVSMIRSLVVVNAHQRSQVGVAAAAWIEHAIAAQLPLTVYDHHPEAYLDIPGKHYVEAVGATTTLAVEALRKTSKQISALQATVMAMGIHENTGSLSFAHTTPRDVYALAWLLDKGASQQAQSQHNQSVTAQDIMSSPVRTIRPATTVAEAQRILLRYGYSGLCIADDGEQLQGSISRRDIDLALHYGFGNASVEGHMTPALKTISLRTCLSDIQTLMATYDLSRLPVFDSNKLVGIVTRTDVLRQVYPLQSMGDMSSRPLTVNLYQRLQTSLQTGSTELTLEDPWTLLLQLAHAAQQQGWHLYLVGGAVRDLLLTPTHQTVSVKDIDLVVDSFRSPVVEGAGVVLAQQLQQRYPNTTLQIHEAFQTATLSWSTQADQAPLTIDIATARIEFYPYPAANPEVESSSIHQDLYRRDFTINAMAVRLTSPQSGLLLDFFGGYLDIQQRQVRVLHANSFIEDPTRIFRAVRFAIRLGFTIDSQTETFIRYAIASGIYTNLQTQNIQKRLPALQARLKAELTQILKADYWAQSLWQLNELGALSCLHPSLTIDAELWRQMHRAGRWQQRFAEEVGKDIDVEAWLIRLEILLARVETRVQIATNLQLPLGSIQRLQQLATIENAYLAQFPHADDTKPSFVYKTFVSHRLSTLLLISVRHPQKIGTYVWQYITRFIHIRPPINGNHLRRLGYKPGPLYRQILTTLTYAVLDGKVTSAVSAEDYLSRHYPLEEK